jgi:hypothetical protein
VTIAFVPASDRRHVHFLFLSALLPQPTDWQITAKIFLVAPSYLYSNNTINKFKNKGVSDGINPFKEYKIYIVNHNIDDLHIPVKTSISIANTLSDAKGLTQDLATNLYRQSHPKISKNIDFKQVLSQLKQNRTEVIQKKLAALHQLKVKFQETQI